MFINDLPINVGYETWTLRVAPIEPFSAPTVTITDAKGHVHFQGSEEEAFIELVRIIAREHQSVLSKDIPIDSEVWHLEATPVHLEINDPKGELAFTGNHEDAFAALASFLARPGGRPIRADSSPPEKTETRNVSNQESKHKSRR